MITEKQYYDLLSYAEKLLDGKKLMVNKYDLVHTAIAEGKDCTNKTVKAIFYEQQAYAIGGREPNKHLDRLTQTKVCKGCPQEGPLPVSMFYLCTDRKSNRQLLSTYCCVCNSKKSSKRFTQFRCDEKHILAHRKACKRYYDKIKKDPAIIKKRKKDYNTNMLDPAYRETRRLYTANWRIKNNKGCKTPKNNLPPKERVKQYRKKHYAKKKKDKDYIKKRQAATRAWRERVKDTPEYKKKNADRYKRWKQKQKKLAAASKK